MTTVTITIDDPNGQDSNFIFLSSAPYQFLEANRKVSDEGDSAYVKFHRYSNGVVDTSTFYKLSAEGTNFSTTDFGLSDIAGNISSLQLNRAPNGTDIGITLIHATFSLDGPWQTVGGVTIPSLTFLTADTLMGRIQQATSANLVVVGNIGDDTLNGSFLDDTLRGGAGADQLNGGLGTDTASYEGSNSGVTVNLLINTTSGGDAAGDHLSSIENILGTNFSDNITGDGAANFIDGALGFDTIEGGDGDDFIFGRDGGGILRGGAGNDRIDGGTDNDTIYGGTGNDELRVGTGNNTAYGEDGNDILLGAAGNDKLLGGAGTDNLQGISGKDILDGGTGADSMSQGIGAATYYVDNPGDTAFDVGDGDNDLLLTSISFALGAGWLIERFATTNNAGTGVINLTGNGNNQAITGNAGNNTIDGGGGADAMTGLGGNDKYFVDNALDKVTEAAGGGIDQVLVSISYALTANSSVELLTTTNAAGTAAIDLSGNALAQTIEGNKGANVINGGLGSDTLRGFNGSDTFAFTTALGVANVDTIIDYNVAGDTIRLENSVFTGLAVGGLAAGAFFKGGSAHDADDRIIYNATNGALFFDQDGTGAAAAVRFATVSTGLSMTNNDFVVV